LSVYLWTFVLLYGHLVCFVDFMAIWYIFPFWYVVLRKIWRPSALTESRKNVVCSLKGSVCTVHVVFPHNDEKGRAFRIKGTDFQSV
jgi:hypothetical protein